MGRRSTPPLPTSPGIYVILLEASAGRRIRVGALGTLAIEPGFYGYVGSAHGPGGLAARVRHHRRRTRLPHWHIDYLRRHTAFREAWIAEGDRDWEHRWAAALADDPSASIPLARFGATDCTCRSHLFRFDARPHLSNFMQKLGARAARVGPEPPPTA
ncbi:MAG: GIY-YIG nuclease family protein [Deltaproteobacteria bacterium]|nr:GIY-YIG nuclease family protein [Deltaproteobacteria bacterium]MBW2445207.1 GIY-YIG nuclease family protein [Deltaproteobacteria bacterium]